jgi:hypothetical protein
VVGVWLATASPSGADDEHAEIALQTSRRAEDTLSRRLKGIARRLVRRADMPRSSMGIHAERTHLGRKRKTRTRYGAIAIPPGISKVTSGRNNSLLNAEISSITCLTLVCNSDRLLHHAHVLKCGPRGWRTKVQTDLRVEEGSKEVELTSLGRPLVVAGFALSISGRFSAVHRGPFGRLSVRWKPSKRPSWITEVTPHLTAGKRLLDSRATSDQGFAKSLAVARTCAHADDGNVHPDGSVGETGSPRIDDASEVTLRAFQGDGQTHRVTQSRTVMRSEIPSR